MRRLNRQVLAGGVVHPAGTEANDELEGLITNKDFWTDDEITISEADHQEAAGGGAEATDTVSERETALRAEVERLTTEVERLTAENAELREQSGQPAEDAPDGNADGQPAAGPDPVPPAPAEDYSESNVKALQAEIKLRNQGRDTPIQVEEPGNKPELIAALVADDQTRA